MPALPTPEMPKERKDEKKADGKKKTQAEIEQEMAALQYTNPMLLEVSVEVLHSSGQSASWSVFCSLFGVH